MKTLKFQNKEEWLQARVGKITGTKLKDIIVLRGNTPKKGFWELIAERIAEPADGENPMDRGTRLEGEAIEKFVKATKKKVDTSLVMWISADNESVAISPDGTIGKTEAVEAKCLNSASHIEALWTKKMPSEYYFQTLQYFIVNPQLKTLYFAFYDPRIPSHDFFYLTVKRAELEEDIAKIKADELAQLKEIERITLELVGF